MFVTVVGPKQITQERKGGRRGLEAEAALTQPTHIVLSGLQSMILSQLASDKRKWTEKGRQQQL